MVPSITPKDVVLVEKVTPVFKRLLHIPVARAGDILFFTAPERMLKYIDQRHLPKIQPNSLIIKRVSNIVVSDDGAARRDAARYDMRGDYPEVSIDSRDWGLLGEKDIVGTPLLRVWPLNRIGPVK